MATIPKSGGPRERPPLNSGPGRQYLAKEPFAQTANLGGTINHDRNWDLRRNAEADSDRHRQRVKEALRKEATRILVQQPDFAIVTPERKIIVRAPIQEELPHFRFRSGGKDHIGQGPGGSKVGDKIGRDQAGQGSGAGGAGSGGDIVYDEREFYLKDYLSRLFDDLELPLTARASAERADDDVKFTTVRKTGAMANLDKKRTMLANLPRRARERSERLRELQKAGLPTDEVGPLRPGNLRRDEMRFRSWEETERPVNAVVIAIMDVSPSMGQKERDAAKALLALQYYFLKAKYPGVDLVMIAHAGEAREIPDVAKFFAVTGIGGGTQAGVAFELANKIIDDRYNPDQFDIFTVYVGDGENEPNDLQRCSTEANRLINRSTLFGLAEVQPTGKPPSLLRTRLEGVAKSGKLEDKYVVADLPDVEAADAAIRKMYPKGGIRNSAA